MTPNRLSGKIRAVKINKFPIYMAVAQFLFNLFRYKSNRMVVIMWTLTLTVILAFTAVSRSRGLPFEMLIIGGELAPTNSFPYQVGLYINKDGTEIGTFWCGGTLIYPDYVLTAAHCLYGGTVSVAVIFGTNDIDNVASSEKMYIQLSGIIINPDFDPSLTRNDIALLRLPTSFTVNAAVQTIQLATSSMNQNFLQGKTVTTSGWGYTSATSTEITDELRYVKLTVISLTDCAAYFNSRLIQSTNICTSGVALSGPCNGDSGGPLTYQADDGSLYLVGLTSFGSSYGCQSGSPNAYTRITSYLDWIAENTGYT